MQTGLALSGTPQGSQFETRDMLSGFLSLTSCLSMLYALSCTTSTIQGKFINNYSLSLSHSQCSMSPWAHLSNMGSSRFSCLFTMCPRNDQNVAKITLPSPDEVEVALQDRWLAQGHIQG